jgi:hypothetical protein
MDLPEVVGNGVGFLGAAGLHLKLCLPKNVMEFTFGVKATVRANANTTVY